MNKYYIRLKIRELNRLMQEKISRENLENNYNQARISIEGLEEKVRNLQDQLNKVTKQSKPSTKIQCETDEEDLK